MSSFFGFGVGLLVLGGGNSKWFYAKVLNFCLIHTKNSRINHYSNREKESFTKVAIFYLMIGTFN